MLSWCSVKFAYFYRLVRLVVQNVQIVAMMQTGYIFVALCD